MKFQNLRWALAWADNFSLNGLPVFQRILAAAVSCGVFALGTLFGVIVK